MTGPNVAPLGGHEAGAPAGSAGTGEDTGAGWQPVESVQRDAVSARSVLALQDLLDDGAAPPAPDREVPILWHWLAFLPRAPQRDLDVDGHPRRGGFLPPVPLPRRMIAGGRVEANGRIAVDEPLVRRGVVTSVQEKLGRSGPFVLVTARFEIGPAGPEDGSPSPALILEEQDIVYRDAAPRPVGDAGAGAGVEGLGATGGEGPDSPRWAWRWDLEIDPRLLFRFSALTYNAHRIHYDRPWATEVEGYPGLVVHGPLQAVALAELCRRYEPRSWVSQLRYRAIRPKFDDGPLLLRGAPDGDSGVEMTAFDHHGVATMQASASLGR